MVAVDPGAREIRWAYKYDQAQQKYSSPINRIQAQQAGQTVLAFRRWIDTSPVVAGNFVLISPSSSDSLHCLSLHDGQEQWKIDRDDGLYLAGVRDDSAFINGLKKIRAVDPENRP